MNRRVRVLAVDWDRLRGAYPGRDDRTLAAEAVGRARAILAEPIPEVVPQIDPPAERLRSLRHHFAHEAGIIAMHRYSFVTGRERFRAAERDEQRTYELHLELNKDLVPPLKEEARSLRSEIRRLEDELRARGVDPETVEPAIEWERTLAVDTYERPQYETNEGRRQRTVEFFRRLRR